MTPRVLHLLDLAAGEEPALACRAARAIPGFTHDLWTIGPGDRARDSVEPPGMGARIAPPLGAPELAWRGARSLAHDRRRAGGAPDLVQCWSPRTLGLARLTFGRYTPTVALATENPTLHRAACPAHRWGNRSLRHDGPITLVFRLAHWEAWLHVGASDVRLAPPPAPPPAPDDRDAHRRALRRRLGVAPALDAQTAVVVLVADPGSSGDARRFSFIMGLMHTVGRRVIGVVPAGCGTLRPAARFVRAHGRRWGLIESPLPLSALAPAADAALWKSPHGGITLAAAYAAAGVPVVTASASAAGEAASAVAHIPGAAAPVVARGLELRSLAASLLPILDNAAAHPGDKPPAHHPITAPAGPRQHFEDVLTAVWRDALSPPGTNPFALTTPQQQHAT